MPFELDADHIAAENRKQLAELLTTRRTEARYMNQQVENQIMATQTQLKPQTQSKPLNKRETSNLIGSDKVEGTPVYRTNGDHVGQIERVMIDKLSGKVA